MEEIWSDVLGYEGKYLVSDEGGIKLLPNNKYRKERLLKPTTWGGYKKIALTKDGKRKYYWVHRLVWEAFNGPIPEELEIDHIDGNPSNNSLYNLRAVDHLTYMSNPVTIERKRRFTDWEKKKRNREHSLRYYYEHREEQLERHKKWYQKYKSAKDTTKLN